MKTNALLVLRDLPRYERIRDQAARYPNTDADAVNAYLVLLKVTGDLMASMEELLQAEGLSRARFVVLMTLNRDDTCVQSPVDIARMCAVTRATMTGLLEGLDKDGLIARRPHDTDRRMQQIELTPAAKKLLGRLLPQYYGQLTKLMSPMPTAQKRQLVNLLTQLDQKNAGGNPCAADG